MNDEYLDFFLSKFDAPTEVVAATSEQVESYRGILPDKLLEYWHHLGFSGFKNGLFWLTNPSEFGDVLESFLNGTEFEDFDNYHVIARSAYGELFLWGENTGYSLAIKPHLNWIKTCSGHERDISQGKADSAVQAFIGFRKPENVDIKANSKPLFPSVLKKHGPIGKDEVMVFTPYLFMGGKKSVDKMSKENLHVFLQVMADLGGAEAIDMASIVGNVIKHYES